MDSSFLEAISKFIIIILIWSVVVIVAEWKIFTKAGKPGWHILIPFLNTYDMFEFSWSAKMGYVAIGLSLLSSVLASAMRTSDEPSGVIVTLSSVVSLTFTVISFVEIYKLSKSFGHGIGFFLGIVFLSPIFLLILAFGSSQYIGPNGVPQMPQGYGAPGYGAPGGYGAPAPNAGYEVYGQAVQPGQPGYGTPQNQQQGYAPQQQGNPFENNNNNYGNYQ